MTGFCTAFWVCAALCAIALIALILEAEGVFRIEIHKTRFTSKKRAAGALYKQQGGHGNDVA